MTENTPTKKKRFWEEERFWQGLGVGFAVPTLLGIGMLWFIWFTLIPGIEEATAMSSESFDTVEALYDECNAARKELYSSVTVLHELEPGQGIELFEGLIEIAPGSLLGGRNSYGKMTMRWFIPVKVKPLVYDRATGYAYSWWNPKTEKFEGPFQPEVSR